MKNATRFVIPIDCFDAIFASPRLIVGFKDPLTHRTQSSVATNNPIRVGSQITVTSKNELNYHLPDTGAVPLHANPMTLGCFETPRQELR